jgi:lysine 6-dehydrogenase
MKILILGLGLMGPTIAKDCAESADVSEVLGCDVDRGKLTEALEYVSNPKFDVEELSVLDHAKLVNKMKDYDLVIHGTSSRFSINALVAAMEAKVNIVDLAGGGYPQRGKIYDEVMKAGITVIPGCGVDPGLIDILSGNAIMSMDQAESIIFACGGLPQDPEPPLDYKIVFGGEKMPVRPGLVPMIEDGKQIDMDRYSEVEPIFVDGLNPMEAFTDGYPSSLLNLCLEKGVQSFRGKTIRYSGFVEKIMFLNDLGLISEDPIDYEGRDVIPRELFHKVIYPIVKFDTAAGDRDLTVMIVRVEGVKNNDEILIEYDMVDFYDEERGITSMAKTTGFTAALIARFLGKGKIEKKGIVWPVRAIQGELVEELLSKLRVRGVKVTETITKTRGI